MRLRPRRWSIASCRLPTGRMASPSTQAASLAFAAGSIRQDTPFSRAAIAMDSAPRTVSTSPESDNSPTAARPPSASRSMIPQDAMIASAMGRSYAGPSLRTSAGERLIVMRATGKLRRQLAMAARTRSRLSLTAASGRPTSSNMGIPSTVNASTVTRYPSMPDRPMLLTLASIRAPSQKPFLPLFYLFYAAKSTRADFRLPHSPACGILSPS